MSRALHYNKTVLRSTDRVLKCKDDAIKKSRLSRIDFNDGYDNLELVLFDYNNLEYYCEVHEMADGMAFVENLPVAS